MLAALLSDRERRFCEEFAVDLNRKRAAIAAGSPESNAINWACDALQRPHVQEYLEFLKSEQSIRTKITADYVLNTIVETIERCRGRVETKINEDGDEVPDKVFDYDPKSILKGSELLGKHLKIFTDVSEQKHTFTQMPSVLVGTAKINEETGEQEMTALVFNVGSDANVPNS